MKRSKNSNTSAKRPIDGKFATWLEIAAVLFVIAAPTLADMGCTLFWGKVYQAYSEDRRELKYRSATVFDSSTFERMISQLHVVPIMLLVMWRSGAGWRRFGLGKPKIAKDLAIGLALWLVVATFDGLIALAFNRPHPWSCLHPVAIPASRALLLVGECCAIGFSEELVMRAYLIPRVEAITGVSWKAVLLSVIVFGLIHFYKGYFGVIHSAVAGAVWGIAFCFTRRIWPIALSHAIVDFVVDSHIAAMIGT